jgi:AhpD family alkylhydroperoxidase
VIICLLGFPAAAQAPDSGKKAGDATEASFAEMKSMFGAVPTFMKLFPPAAVPGVWQEMKALELNPNTAIPGKYKSLISLGVSAQIPCTYCIYFDTQGAKSDGASPQEIAEAVVMSAITRRWSTVLNGSLQDEGEFRKEADRVFAHAKQGGPPPAAAPLTDGASALKDIEQTLGSVPTFLRRYPPAALPGAWLEFKTIQLGANTAIPPKYKELLGLAVSAQIPCRYCIYFHTQGAKANGATQAELDEAIALAALTRHWSTFVNGLQLDEKTFRKEVDGIFKHMKKTPGRAESVSPRRQTPTSTAPVR